MPAAAILINLHDQYMLKDQTAPIFNEIKVSFSPLYILRKVGAEINLIGMKVNIKLNLRIRVTPG